METCPDLSGSSGLGPPYRAIPYGIERSHDVSHVSHQGPPSRYTPEGPIAPFALYQLGVIASQALLRKVLCYTPVSQL